MPNARPRDEDAKHSYPILAKVEVIGTPTLFGVPIPFRRQHFWKGHLDYLGIHGFSVSFSKSFSECFFFRGGSASLCFS